MFKRRVKKLCVRAIKVSIPWIRFATIFDFFKVKPKWLNFEIKISPTELL